MKVQRNFKTYGIETITIQERIDNLKSTLKGFSKNVTRGSDALGELDFWKHQQKKTKA